MTFLSRLCFLLCLPALLLYSNPSPFPLSLEKGTGSSFACLPRDAEGKLDPWKPFRLETLSLDQYLHFLQHLETPAFWESLTHEELRTVIHFLAHVVPLGLSDTLFSLEKDPEIQIQAFLESLIEEDALSFALTRSSFCQKPHILLCKRSKSKKIQKIRRWCRKHRAPLIMAGSVIGVLTVAAVTAGVGASTAVAIGGALVEKSSKDSSRPPVYKPGEIFQESPLPLVSINPSLPSEPLPHPSIDPLSDQAYENVAPLSKILEESLEFVEADLPELFSPKEAERPLQGQAMDHAKALISWLAHDLLNGASQLVEISPETVYPYHEKIDQVLGTQTASRYTPEVLEKEIKVFEIILPLLTKKLPLKGTAGKVTKVARLKKIITTAAATAALSRWIPLAKYIDHTLPKDPKELLTDPYWKETTHPEAQKKGHRIFYNQKTGEKLQYDLPKLKESGHNARGHWHRFNPNSEMGKRDQYLDAQGNPVAKGHDLSHLYPPPSD